MPAFISKSAYLNGLQCSKLLWVRFNAKEELAEPDAAQQAIFDQGHDVGGWAKRLFPDGVEIDCDHSDYELVLRLSSERLVGRKPLFEAGFQNNGGFARVDVLEPSGKSRWNIVEVKSSTELKEINLHDIAFQTYVLRGAGVQVDRCFLMHVNNSYVRKGEVDAHGLFTKLDVTAEIQDALKQVETNLIRMQQTVAAKSRPTIQIGPQCDDPYTCPLHDRCWEFLPDNHLLTLYRVKKEKAFELIKRAILAIDQLPKDFKLTDNQTIQTGALRKNRPFIDKPAIRAFLSQLRYPVAYLDFETFNSAIPLFDQVSPYQQVPFQFSLHVVEAAGQPPTHHSFLADDQLDPRPAFLACLKECFPSTGSIVVYNAAFEKSVLKQCCELLPSYQPWLTRLSPRIVDLLLPFRGFRYYHPGQAGSASMKQVLPALTGSGYSKLAIQEGGQASREFLRVTYGRVDQVERKRVRNNLEEYCGLDTSGMVEIVEALRKVA